MKNKIFILAMLALMSANANAGWAKYRDKIVSGVKNSLKESSSQNNYDSNNDYAPNYVDNYYDSYDEDYDDYDDLILFWTEKIYEMAQKCLIFL